MLAAVAQATVPALVPLGLASADIGERSAAVRTPVVPAGYAFAIWGVIFALAIAYALWQAQPKLRTHPLLRRVGWWTAVAFAGCALWEVAAQSAAPDWVLLAIITGALAAALGGLFRLKGARRLEGFGRWLVGPVVGLLAGWLTAATFANVSTVFRTAGVQSDLLWLGLIVAAGLTAAVVLIRTGGDRAYLAAVAWALVGVAVANRTEQDEPAVLFTALAMLVVAAGAAVVGRRRRRA